MGLSCGKFYRDKADSKFTEQNENWIKAAGYLFRPGFYNELTESVYENTQLQYHILWRRIQAIPRRRVSISNTGLYNSMLYSQWKQYIRT